MRFFFLQDYQHWLLSTVLGIVLFILVYLAFKSYWYSKQRAGQNPRQKTRYPDGLESEHFPAPPLLLALYLGLVVWAICYVIFIGILHGPI
jgi:hypothetical protein